MWLHEIEPGTPEADALARKILTALYECAAMSRGLDPNKLEITITRTDEPEERTGYQ